MMSRYCNYCGYHHSTGRHLVERAASNLGISRAGIYWWLSILSIFPPLAFVLYRIFTQSLFSVSSTEAYLEFGSLNLLMLFGILMLMHAFHEDNIAEKVSNRKPEGK